MAKLKISPFKILDTSGRCVTLAKTIQGEGIPPAMLANLKIYYRRHSMQLGTALFAAFAAATIQIKYWVFYGHECLRLNPYQVGQAHKAHASKIDFGASDCLGAAAKPLALPAKPKKHDHNHCPICQSFQQLTAAIFEPRLSPYQLPYLTSEGLALSYLEIFYFQEGHSEASPRAPPLSLEHRK